MSTAKRITKLLRVPAKELAIHPLVQRDLIPKHLAEIEADMDLDSLGTLQAVQYPISGETKLWIVDGQHRLKALMNLDLGDWEVDVLLHINVTDDKTAARIFLKHSESRPLNTYHKFRQEVIAEDPTAIGVTEILERREIKVSATQADGGICCFGAAKKLYLLDQGETLAATLDTATAAWGKTARALDGKLLEGLSCVLRKANGRIERESLIVKLAKYPGGAPGVIGKARTLRDLQGGTMTKAVMEIIAGVYNTGRRNKKIEL